MCLRNSQVQPVERVVLCALAYHDWLLSCCKHLLMQAVSCCWIKEGKRSPITSEGRREVHSLTKISFFYSFPQKTRNIYIRYNKNNSWACILTRTVRQRRWSWAVQGPAAAADLMETTFAIYPSNPPKNVSWKRWLHHHHHYYLSNQWMGWYSFCLSTEGSELSRPRH